MATSKSAEKRLRQSKKRHAVNQQVKSRIKSLRKKVMTAAGSKDEDATAAAMKECFSALDKAAKKGTYHKRKIARDKSRLCAAAKRASA